VSNKIIRLVALAALVVVLDQWVKYLVMGNLTTAFDGRATLGEKLKTFYSNAPAEGWDGLHYRPKKAVTVSENFLRIRYAENPGAAWGLFRTLPERVRGPMFHLVSLGAVILITSYFLRLTGDRAEVWARWGLPLVLGGAIGNYVCRLARGFVIDFIEAHWFSNPHLVWPSFNVADSAICIGVGMLIVDSFVRRDRKADAPVGSAPRSG
jgi:signal peptidase II